MTGSVPLHDDHDERHAPLARPVRAPSPLLGGPMHSGAELIGAAVALLGLGLLTLASVRSITRR
ncbi:hypothetical protein GCM10009535_07810 [Streptomyces thermocarboxydovorans]|uniref:LPXTG cell wall anchor domain-containing protein n=1 Tax=Streptomyces thermocarboxydovorans TaxID=59298 RepID=A0ABN1H9I4_9ACTN